MRLVEWSHNLDNLIDDLRHKNFLWGSNDCLTFANQAHKAMTARPLADDWVGDYSCALAARRHYDNLLQKQGFDTIVDAIDKRLERINVALPPRGSLVARHQPENPVIGFVLGVCVGEKIAFISNQGVLFLHSQPDDIFWAI